VRWSCGDPAISLHSHHASLVQWTNPLLPVTRDLGSKSPRGHLCETGILLLAMSLYIGDPNVIDHCGLVWDGPCLRRASSEAGLVWGGLHPKLSLGPRTDNVIIPLDLTQLSCPVSCSLQVSLPASQPTESAAGGEPCGDPAISLHSHHVSLVQWTNPLFPVTRDLGSNPLGGYLCETGILLLAMSRYSPFNIGWVANSKGPCNHPNAERKIWMTEDNSPAWAHK
jgi:hypothetical protein